MPVHAELYDTFYFAKPSQFDRELDVNLFDLPDGNPA
jgi:hypothetical protein